MSFFNREEDADHIFRDAEALNLTGEGYAWIVSEQALTSAYVPTGEGGSVCLSVHNVIVCKHGQNLHVLNGIFPVN